MPIFALIRTSRGEKKSMIMGICLCRQARTSKSRWARAGLKIPKRSTSQPPCQENHPNSLSNYGRCKLAASREQCWISKDWECLEPESKRARAIRTFMKEHGFSRTRKACSALVVCGRENTRYL